MLCIMVDIDHLIKKRGCSISLIQSRKQSLQTLSRIHRKEKESGGHEQMALTATFSDLYVSISGIVEISNKMVDSCTPVTWLEHEIYVVLVTEDVCTMHFIRTSVIENAGSPPRGSRKL